MKTILTALFLVSLVMGLYWGCIHGPLAGDAQVLASDPRVQAITPENVEQIFTRSYYAGQIELAVFRPAVTLSFLLINVFASGGTHPEPHHLFNLVLHCLNVLLVWRIARAVWLRAASKYAELGALFAAALFAVHPANVEGVANVAGRADLMAAFGVLAGLAWHIRKENSSPWSGLLILCAGLTGMFSKENAIVLPGVIVLFDVIFRRENIRLLLWNYAGAALAAAVLLVVRALMVSRWVTVGFPFLNNPIHSAGYIIARLTAVEAVWRYLGLLFWPKSLSWDYSFNQIPLATPAGGALALAGLAILVALACWSVRVNRAVCFLGLFFLVALSPVSNLLFTIGSLMAERFLYLPSFGIFGCVVAAILWVAGKTGARAPAVIAGCCTVLCATLAARTWDRNRDWADYPRLLAHDALSAPNSYLTHAARMDQLARTSRDPVKIAEAIREGEAAVAILKEVPLEVNDSRAYSGLAALYRIQGDMYAGLPSTARPSYEKSLAYFERAEAIDQAVDRRFHRIQIAAGTPGEQIKRSGEPALYQGLILASERIGDHQRALRAAEYLSRLAPGDATTYANVATLQMQLGNLEGAILSRWKALLVEGTPEGQEELLVEAYRRYAPESCAVKRDTVNRDCDLVHRHWCLAQRQLADSLAEAGFPEDAEEKRQHAVSISNCSGL